MIGENYKPLNVHKFYNLKEMNLLLEIQNGKKNKMKDNLKTFTTITQINFVIKKFP